MSRGVGGTYPFGGKKRVCAGMLKEIVLGDLGSMSSRLDFSLWKSDISQGNELMATRFSKMNLLATLNDLR